DAITRVLGSGATRRGIQWPRVFGASSSNCHGACSFSRYQLLILVFSAQNAVSIIVTARSAPDESKAQWIGLPGSATLYLPRSPVRALTASMSLSFMLR